MTASRDYTLSGIIIMKSTSTAKIKFLQIITIIINFVIIIIIIINIVVINHKILCPSRRTLVYYKEEIMLIQKQKA